MIQNLHIPALKIADIFRSHEFLVVCFYCGQPKDILINNHSSFKKITCPSDFSSLLFFKLNKSNRYVISYEGHEYPFSLNEYNNIERKFSLSTMVKNEDKYIIPWINFHRSIGFEHFIIYDNSEVFDNVSWTSSSNESNLELALKEYVDSGLVTLIKWNIPKRIHGRLYGQASQQTHSLYAFSNSEYIGYIDIDEYINLKQDSDINSFLQSIDSSHTFDCFCFRSRLFHNPDNKSEKPTDFLCIDTCDQILDEARKKSIVKTKLTQSFAVHLPTSHSSKYIIPKASAYINHYFFLNKNYRGKNSTKYLDKTILKHIINNEYFTSGTRL